MLLPHKDVTHNPGSGLIHEKDSRASGLNPLSPAMATRLGSFCPWKSGWTEFELYAPLGFPFSGVLHMVFRRKQQKWSL